MKVDPKKVSKQSPRSEESKKRRLEVFEKETKAKLLHKLKEFNAVAYEYFRELDIDFNPLEMEKVTSIFNSRR